MAGDASVHRGQVLGTVAYLGGVPPAPEWLWSWTQMVEFNAEHFGPGRVRTDQTRSTYHSSARNELVRHMQGEWLLQLDTDHTFEPDLLWRLLDTADRNNLDVISGLYQTRGYPHHPVIYHWVDGGAAAGQERLEPITRWAGGWPVIQVGSAGGGCLLVRKHVYDRVKRETGHEPFDVEHPWSEDHSFFLRCRRLGVKCFCDTRVRYAHLKTAEVTEADFPFEAFPGRHSRDMAEVRRGDGSDAADLSVVPPDGREGAAA